MSQKLDTPQSKMPQCFWLCFCPTISCLLLIVLVLNTRFRTWVGLWLCFTDILNVLYRICDIFNFFPHMNCFRCAMEVGWFIYNVSCLIPHHGLKAFFLHIKYTFLWSIKILKGHSNKVNVFNFSFSWQHLLYSASDWLALIFLPSLISAESNLPKQRRPIRGRVHFTKQSSGVHDNASLT